MHLLRLDRRSLDETADAVDLGHSPAEICFLSFSDSDLAALAAAHDRRRHPTLRLASLAALKHPYSVDLYLDATCSAARVVLVRLLGGLDYWRYGVEELTARARSAGFELAVIPGDARADPRLRDASTMEPRDLATLWSYFQQGGPDNLAACLDFIGARLGRPGTPAPPRPVPAFGFYPAARRVAETPAGGEPAPKASIVFYRSAFLAQDAAPIVALADALAARGFDASAAFVSSLKDPDCRRPLAAWMRDLRPDIVISALGFSARDGDAPSPLDCADAPVLQVVLAGSSEEQWLASQRGLRAADLAMNVVLPEIDGRILARAISFKAEADRDDALEFTRVIHRPNASRVNFAAELAKNWAALRRGSRADKKLAMVLSDYPLKGGREGYAVGLDTYASVVAIGEDLARRGWAVTDLPSAERLAAGLQNEAPRAALSVESYERCLQSLPRGFADSVMQAWGAPESDPAIAEGAFHFRFARCGRLIVAIQPDRGRRERRKDDYHDGAMPPRHAFVAFYLWLRESEAIDALIHCGTHGSLEWLPGKAVALSEDCAPEATLGPTPLIYPFIVNNPGEAAQAKRRASAVMIGHLTPPLVAAGAHGAVAELESLLDEYSEAQSLDPRRAERLADLVLARADETGLLSECGAGNSADPIARLDAWICDLKEMRIADGLHVFGRSPAGAQREATIDGIAGAVPEYRAGVATDIDRCGPAELEGLAAALDGRFVAPGPAGAPARGRRDTLPTGRNLYGADPRAIPTRTAWEIGRLAAAAVVERYAQDQGEWPRRIVLDLWGSATVRTGGDDFAQALALLGVRPTWDMGSARVTGFEILPPAQIGRPRVDVTLRISGLFRDMFATQIALFDAAARAVARTEESLEDNPLLEAPDSPRIFGAPFGRYGVGLSSLLASGDWRERGDLGRAYLDAGAQAYGAADEGVADPAAFARRVAAADAFVHAQDLQDRDVLESDAFAQHEGGFAAAAQSLGADPAIYHLDSSRLDGTRIRTIEDEIARVLRGRATNPRWLAGMMRHGHRGAAEIAETVDNLHAWAALTDAAPSRCFDLLFDAVCADESVRGFIEAANPRAAAAIADKFADAEKRGFWTSRRNSSTAILAAMRSADG